MDIKQLNDYFINTLGSGRGYQQDIIFSFLCDAAKESHGGVVLDAGAGHQRYKPFFANAIYLAQEHPVAGVENKGIHEYDILSDVKSIPLCDNSVDLVLSTSSLEHMEFPERFFAEAMRVLKPGGALYINVPFIYQEHEAPYDFQRPTRYGLYRDYLHNGFERVTVAPTSSSIYTAQYFLRVALYEDRLRLKKTWWMWVKVGFLRLISKYFTSLLMRICDQGPFDNTTFPIGWIAKGYKKGERDCSLRYDTKEAFIVANAKIDDLTVVENGRIRVVCDPIS